MNLLHLIIQIILLMSINPESYIQHQLNTSKTKQTHVFPKSIRFPKFNKLNTEAVYELPSTKTKRTCTFGYGSKVDLAVKTSSPPPGTYKSISQFQKKQFINVPSIALGRDLVKFGSFIDIAVKSTKNVPSPDKYHIKLPWTKVGGTMGERIQTEPDLKYQRSIPGPGQYHLNVTQMKQSGKYILSNFKNHISPRLFSQNPNRRCSSPGLTASISYDTQEKTIGKYSTSKYKNIAVRTFGKEVRPGLADQSKKYIPGFKYRRFSEFGDVKY